MSAMLLESGGEQRRYLLTLVIALAAHAAVLVVGHRLERARPIAPPKKYVPVEVAVPEKPKPPPPAPPPVAQPKPKVVDLTQPKPAPTEAAKTAEPPKPVFGLGRKSFGTTGGFGVRVGNTVGMRPEDSPSVLEQEVQPLPTYQVTTLPRIRSQPQPNYPPALRTAGIEGDVILELLIDAEGNTVEATIVESSNPDFNAAALEAGRAVKFAPARQGDQAVAVKIRFPIRFRLR